MFAGLPIATEWDTANGSTVHGTEYKNGLDRLSEQEQAYIDWATPLFKDITVNHNGDLKDGDLSIMTVSWVVYQEYFNIILESSMVYLVFSIAIVLVYMSIHLNSMHTLSHVPWTIYIYGILTSIE